MKQSRSYLLLVCAGLALTSFAADVKACSCRPITISEGYHLAEAVFVGTVVDIQYARVQHGDEIARFRIGMSWHGVFQSEVEVQNSDPDSGLCGYRFEVGKRYLVYAGRFSSDSRLATSTCSRKRLLEKATEDLFYIASQSLPNLQQGSRLYGVALKRDRAEATPLVNAPVIAQNGRQTFEVRTDSRGFYQFLLPPGRYQVRLEAPEGFHVLPIEVEFQDTHLWKRHHFMVWRLPPGLR